MVNDDKNTGTTLTITAEIISKLDEGFIIKLYNDETNETREVESVDEYADYIISATNFSTSSNFQAQWLPSPNARKSDIDFIGTKLGEIQKRFNEELEHSDA